ncbi:MAG TPA: hypothetical protein VEX43_05260 [Chthoniobacterales bacterium]|nr:hypothetical protein [Chthoniobacterales bacterium]
MKTILIAVLMLAFAASAFAGQRFDAAQWRAVQTYDVPVLVLQQGSLLGKIVGVRFNYRSEKLRGMKPNWYEASLWQRDPKAKKGFSFVRAMVAKKDIPAFQTITSNFQSPAEITVYGRVERDPENNFVYLRLLGRKAAIDSSGNATVDW